MLGIRLFSLLFTLLVARFFSFSRKERGPNLGVLGGSLFAWGEERIEEEK